MTSNDMSGNKIRKLEFLLAEAIKLNHDCVVTAGGEQSNHCRATAVAARLLGIDPYLILRTNTSPEQLSFTGNLLISRMVNSQIRTVTPDIYHQKGSLALIESLANELRQQHRNPFCIPVGGSNALGSFGYINAVAEIIEDCVKNGLSEFDHIVFSCGSGGTAAGIALGVKLAGLRTKVHAFGVCDTPEEFYEVVRDVAHSLGVDTSPTGKYGPPSDWIAIHSGVGAGYARVHQSELDFVCKVSTQTGVILDHVYSGKALYHFYQLAQQSPQTFQRGQKVLFIHTGGLFGLYSICSELSTTLPSDQISQLIV